MDLHGTGGSLTVGYQRAATLRAWRVQMDRCGTEAVIAATLADVDPFWVTQRPLDVALTLGARSWRWRGVLTQTLDPCVLVAAGVPESVRVPA